MSDYEGKHKLLFPIIDEMVDYACSEIEDEGEKVSCAVGCDHCCHLLIEVSWEEAMEVALWISQQEQQEQGKWIERVRRNANEARELFDTHSQGARYKKPVFGQFEIPDELYDAYFYDKKRPCHLLQDGKCSAYHVRPTSCRLHMVVSDPSYCSIDSPAEDENFDVPDRVEQLKDEASPVILALEKDGRWGHFGVMVEAAIEDLTKDGKFELRQNEGGEFLFAA